MRLAAYLSEAENPEIWQNVRAELMTTRTNSLSFCEARPGKGDVASLLIVDKDGFDAYQTIIKEHASQLAKIEDAIRKLDEMESGWYDDLLTQVQILVVQKIMRRPGYLR